MWQTDESVKRDNDVHDVIPIVKRNYLYLDNYDFSCNLRISKSFVLLDEYHRN